MTRLHDRLRRLLRRASTPPSQRQHQIDPKYRVGRWTYGNPTIDDWDEGATLSIGAFCAIAGGVTISLGGEHRIDWTTTYPFSALWPAARHIAGHPRTKGDVTIGNDVWIGAGAVILSGVTIGDGAVVGTRAVVTRDIAPYAIHAGNPARFVRSRFDADTVQALLGLRWWDRSDAELEPLLPLMLSPDIQAFIAAAQARFTPGATPASRRPAAA